MTESNFMFESRPRDIPSTELEVEGQLPRSLRGRFLANGPGRMHINGQKLHVFDAYGRILSAHLKDGRVTLFGKHVRTPLLDEELAKHAVVKRRLFVNKPSRWSNLFDLDLGNNCMHNVYPFAGHVVAAQDPGHFLLDPDTLAVTGTLGCGGLMKKGMSATPMARVDPASNRLVLWLQKPGPKDTVTIVELDESLEVTHQQTCKLPPGLLHDVTFTERFYVVSRFASLNVLKVLWGSAPVFSATQFNEKTPVLHLIPRRGGKPHTVPLPKRMHFHFFNAFEEDGSVVVDTIGYAGQVTFSTLFPDDERERLGLPRIEVPVPEVLRYRISLDTMRVEERVMPGIACEAPEVNRTVRGRPYRYGYASTRTDNDVTIDPGAYIWFGGLGKLDFEKNEAQVWESPAGCCCSPPAFVPDPERSGEDAGFVLSWIQEPAPGRSSLAIFDAQDLRRGPVARAQFPGLFGAISHTSFFENP
jgi:carotenoid cleavage dioxygenase-like enzyme